MPEQLLETNRSSDTINDMSYLVNIKLKKLLFADDLALFSLSKEGLQRRISILKPNGNKWGLELNLNKVKIMIFSKLGANTRKFKFHLQWQEIERVKQHTYLGFTFIPSLKKKAKDWNFNK